MKKVGWFGCAVAALCWAGSVAAQGSGGQGEDSEPVELELLRLAFARDLIEKSLAPIKEHLDKLVELESKLAEARDYEGAMEVRRERRKIEAELVREDRELLLLESREQSLRAGLLPDMIELPLSKATLNGVSRPGGGGVIEGWSRPGDSATWTLPDLPPGGYEVFLRYRCGALEGGSVLISEARFTLSGRIETTLRGPARRLIGTLKITDGSGELKLEALTVVKDSLMQLLAVELTPSSR